MVPVNAQAAATARHTIRNDVGMCMFNAPPFMSTIRSPSLQDHLLLLEMLAHALALLDELAKHFPLPLVDEGLEL